MKSFAVILVVLNIGCGFGGEFTSAPQSLDDGISPYKFEGSAELCQGTARLVSSELVSDQIGLCHPLAEKSRPCEESSECSGDEICHCGGCTAKLCRFTNECEDGQVCRGNPRRCVSSCDENTPCRAGSVCEQGACTRLCKEPGQSCIAGELCISGACISVACSDENPACSTSERCELQQQKVQFSQLATSVIDRETYLHMLTEDCELESFSSIDGRHFRTKGISSSLSFSGQCPAQIGLVPISMGWELLWLDKANQLRIQKLEDISTTIQIAGDNIGVVAEAFSVSSVGGQVWLAFRTETEISLATLSDDVATVKWSSGSHLSPVWGEISLASSSDPFELQRHRIFGQERTKPHGLEALVLVTTVGEENWRGEFAQTSDIRQRAPQAGGSDFSVIKTNNGWFLYQIVDNTISIYHQN